MTFENIKLSYDENKVNESLKKVKHWTDLTKEGGPLQLMFKETLERMMKEELSEHLGYPERKRSAKQTTNSRNGSYSKTLKTQNGEMEIEVPRDRQGEFEPKVIPKYETIDSQLEEQIISMYAKGMTTRDISEHIKRMYYGMEISATLISKITEKVLDAAKDWQQRPLESVYPIIFMDAIHYKVKMESKVICKAAYVVLGISTTGIKDILGIYLGDNESSAFWLSVLTDLKNRGVQDILIGCVDGLKGFPEAIRSIFPKTETQICIIHQIRNSLRYVVSKDTKPFLRDLKMVYQAINEEVALSKFAELSEKWGKKYPVVINSWEKNWDNLAVFFKYSEEIRKIIYTTNIIESYNRQLRKVTKNRSIFTHDESLFKLMYLATKDVCEKWTMPKQNWAQIITQLSIYFPGRIELGI